MIDVLISIIIPVYNAAKYIEHTIDCILNQSFQKFELILINDGSTDDSKDICEARSLQDNRIRVVNISNSGVSVARNLGVELSNGKYICFVDADDLLHKHTIEKAFVISQEQDADIVSWNMESFYQESEITATDINTVVPHIVEGDAFDYLDKQGAATGVYLKLFKASLIKRNQIEFTRNMTYGEDMFFCWKACILSKKTIHLPAPLYYYRQYQNQTASRYHDRLYESYCASIDDMADFAIKHGVMDDHLRAMLVRHLGKRLPALVRMIVRAPRSILDKVSMIRVLFLDERLQEYSKLASDLYAKCLRNNLPLLLIVYGYLKEYKLRIVKTLKSKHKGYEISK